MTPLQGLEFPLFVFPGALPQAITLRRVAAESHRVKLKTDLRIICFANQMIRKSSTITHRRWRVNVIGLVTPSPVGVAMLKDR